jgi:CopG family transcriptional regulator, nickel-responsive regulator
MYDISFKISYISRNPAVRDLARHLDHDSCLEVAALRSEASAVREFAKTIIAERGVTHGQVSFVPVSIDAATHACGGTARRRTHAHAKIQPRSFAT